jgi:hypothetical protein
MDRGRADSGRRSRGGSSGGRPPSPCLRAGPTGRGRLAARTARAALAAARGRSLRRDGPAAAAQIAAAARRSRAGASERQGGRQREKHKDARAAAEENAKQAG